MSQYDDNNVFARIIAGDFPSQKVFEDDKVLAIKDIHPSAPVHVLVMPKLKFKSFDDFMAKAKPEDITYFFKKVREIAHKLKLEKNGYRLIMNHGSDAMQTVPHFHVHILGERILGPLVVGDTYHR